MSSIELPVYLAGDKARLPGWTALFDYDQPEAAKIASEAGPPVMYVLPAVGQPGSWGTMQLGVTTPGLYSPWLLRFNNGQQEASKDFGVSWFLRTPGLIGTTSNGSGATGSWDPAPSYTPKESASAHAADGEREAAFGFGLFVAGIAALLLLGGKRPKFLR